MNKTKIEWCDMTWNPVTGCLHGCDYCYARGIARRFEGFEPRCGGEEIPKNKGNTPGSIWNDTLGEPIHVFKTKAYVRNKKDNFRYAPFPYEFDPTFHHYRLDEPAKIKKPQNIFVCSMADLFGEWVPDEWISAVLNACKKAPQHRYIFLTKNYRRYNKLRGKEILPLDKNMYFGVSVTTERQIKQACLHWDNIDFLSIEPLSEYIGFDEWSIDIEGRSHWKWVIVGAETGNRKNKVKVEREWVKDIVFYSKRSKAKNYGIGKQWKDIPVFMKNNLRDIWQEPLIQEYPW